MTRLWYCRSEKFAACWVEIAACLPFTSGMSRYDKQRAAKTPPHVTLKGLRRASGMTLEQVAEAVTEVLYGDEIRVGAKPAVNRGTIAAIESGLRGASVQMLDAMAIAYGMEAGDIVTNYEPRRRDLPEAVGL